MSDEKETKSEIQLINQDLTMRIIKVFDVCVARGGVRIDEYQKIGKLYDSLLENTKTNYLDIQGVKDTIEFLKRMANELSLFKANELTTIGDIYSKLLEITAKAEEDEKGDKNEKPSETLNEESEKKN